MGVIEVVGGLQAEFPGVALTVTAGRIQIRHQHRRISAPPADLNAHLRGGRR